MKVLILIRTYPIDDYISYLCWQSWKKVLPDAKIIFFAQKESDPPPGEYRWIVKTGEDIVRRPYCCNFGGRDHVRAYIDGLKQINSTGYSHVICCDADIIVHKNPLDSHFDYGGIRHPEFPWLFSGQLLIMSRWLFDKLVNYPQYEELYNEFIRDGYRSISDDTIFSWLAGHWTKYLRDFYKTDYWEHIKLHHLEPK